MTIAFHPDLASVLRHCQSVILDAQKPSGAYPASEAFSAYRGFCWFRDGSFIADAMSSAGQRESAEAFFDWCNRAVCRRQDQIRMIVAAAEAGRPVPDARMLPTRLDFDGRGVDDQWENFQLDGYGTWIWAVLAHTRRYGLDPTRWAEGIQASADYLVSSWNRPCYDWWEEHSEAIHTSTLGSILAGLRAAIAAGVLTPQQRSTAQSAITRIEQVISEQAVDRSAGMPHLTKWIGNTALDGSLAALMAPLGVIEPTSDLGRGTIAALEEQLVIDGGVYRFRADTFFGGGRWPLLTCFLGLAKTAAGDRAGAADCLTWAVSQTRPNGDVPEQVDGGRLLAPERRQEWVDRWGEVACPLLWSHAMILRLATELGLDSPTVRVASVAPGGWDDGVTQVRQAW